MVLYVRVLAIWKLDRGLVGMSSVWHRKFVTVTVKRNIYIQIKLSGDGRDRVLEL
jgi:hypothetical protein